jgi:hypothetical protein
MGLRNLRMGALVLLLAGTAFGLGLRTASPPTPVVASTAAPASTGPGNAPLAQCQAKLDAASRRLERLEAREPLFARYAGDFELRRAYPLSLERGRELSVGQCPAGACVRLRVARFGRMSGGERAVVLEVTRPDANPGAPVELKLGLKSGCEASVLTPDQDLRMRVEAISGKSLQLDVAAEPGSLPAEAEKPLATVFQAC